MEEAGIVIREMLKIKHLSWNPTAFRAVVIYVSEKGEGLAGSRKFAPARPAMCQGSHCSRHCVSLALVALSHIYWKAGQLKIRKLSMTLVALTLPPRF
mgnify:CR=1 FL=1